jgi:hypothetical protein
MSKWWKAFQECFDEETGVGVAREDVFDNDLAFQVSSGCRRESAVSPLLSWCNPQIWNSLAESREAAG